MTIEKIIAALGVGLIAAKLSKEQEQAILLPLVNTMTGNYGTVSGFNTWVPPQSAEPYLYQLQKTEIKYGLPENLLVRVAYQESRFRDDIIKGDTVSSAGAVGIMQIVPRWHPNVNPLNVNEAIDYAGQYLRSLYTQTGSWLMAIAAYNWGIGNLKKKGFAKAPKETRQYVEQIADDVLKGYA